MSAVTKSKAVRYLSSSLNYEKGYLTNNRHDLAPSLFRLTQISQLLTGTESVMQHQENRKT